MKVKFKNISIRKIPNPGLAKTIFSLLPESCFSVGLDQSQNVIDREEVKKVLSLEKDLPNK